MLSLLLFSPFILLQSVIYDNFYSYRSSISLQTIGLPSPRMWNLNGVSFRKRLSSEKEEGCVHSYRGKCPPKKSTLEASVSKSAGGIRRYTSPQLQWHQAARQQQQMM